MAPKTNKDRPLTLLDVSCLGINSIVGSSIFLFPGLLAQQLGPASIFAFGLTAILLTPVAACFALASSRFDRPGGPYLYAQCAFGATAGFAIGWMCWFMEILSTAAIANAIITYTHSLHPMFAISQSGKIVAAGVILATGLLNYRGVKISAWTSNLLTGAKLLPLLLLVIFGLPHVQLFRLLPFAPHGWAPLGPACFLAYFAFQGFEVAPVPAGEIDRPNRTVPMAILVSLLSSAALYMLIQMVVVGVDPNLAGSEKPLAQTAGIVFGPWGPIAIAWAATVSMAGFCAGAALGGPRYLVALAQDRHMPALFSKIHPRFQTPAHAVLATTILTLAAAMLLDFRRLVDMSNVVVCVQYVATCLSIPFLFREWNGKCGRAMQWGLALSGIAATLWLGGHAQGLEILFAGGVLLLGLILRAFFGTMHL